MPIDYRTCVEGDLLKVKAWGSESDLDNVKRYGMEIVSACIKAGCNKVLVDERELEYQLNVVETFDLAAYYSRHTPNQIRAAIVCDSRFWKDASFWANCSVSKGLHVRVFLSTDSAMHWLEDSR